MKITFIATIFNEETTIDKFLDSLFNQSKFPDEIIIVDANSTDQTIKKVTNYKLISKKNNIRFKILIKKGNRSIGRNEAIKNATGKIIICSDAGNVLDKKWMENITRPFKDKKVEVVAGYYKGLAKNVFQKCLVPYVLVMPDKVNPDNFLPATRSIAFTKPIWKKAGGFDERFSHNEDYIFANRLKEIGAKMVLAKDAISNWTPRDNLKEAFIMFFRFALGDSEAGILRPKVLLLFARYSIFLLLFILYIISKSIFILDSLFLILILYLFWAIKKNYKYVNDRLAIFILPLLQLTADMAVMSGTLIGLIKKSSINKTFITYLIVYIPLLIANIFIKVPGKYFPLALLIISFLPVLLIPLTHKYRTLFLQVMGISLIFGFLMLISFKRIRGLFPIPDINSEKIIGYAQYYGYPLYFDTLLFFSFLLVPAVAFYLLYKRHYQSK